MARPTKIGLDYFALDVKMNDEVEIIEAEHGLEGFAILIKLFQRIYSEGYYHDWTDREQILLSNRIGVDRNKLTTVVNDCIKWNIFNEELYNKYKILTSRRIQEHYFTATYKRVDVLADRRYLLFDVSDRTNIQYNGVTDISNEDTTIVSPIQSTQSKVKDSILEEKKLNDIEIHYMKTLSTIKNYPFDIDLDIKNLEILKERYPDLDIVKGINKFYDYILEKPFQSNAKHRGQLNNSFKMYDEWPNMKKKVDTSHIQDENYFINQGVR